MAELYRHLLLLLEGAGRGRNGGRDRRGHEKLLGGLAGNLLAEHLVSFKTYE